MKNFFFMKDNILDKKMKVLITSYEFSANRKCIADRSDEILKFYALYFTKNDIASAKSQLESHEQNLRRKDVILMSFFGGSLTMIIFMFVALICIPDQLLHKEEGYDSGLQLYSSFYTFRFFFMLIFLLASAGFVVKILKQYRINYMYIFELDPQYKITHAQLFQVITLY